MSNPGITLRDCNQYLVGSWEEAQVNKAAAVAVAAVLEICLVSEE
jgi:hypothetical protein